jgi:NADH/F420H2 dehydrogenase subunit C
MTNEEIKIQISSILPAATYDETGEWLNVTIEADELRILMTLLKNGAGNFDYLFCLTCVDWPTHFTVVYHLNSTRHRNSVVIKAKVPKENPEIETVSNLWKTAEFHEREVYDLFGIKFPQHPDLRRLILTDDFVGHPLRKDFDDPVNMIKL